MQPLNLEGCYKGNVIDFPVKTSQRFRINRSSLKILAHLTNYFFDDIRQSGGSGPLRSRVLSEALII
jgi:hypothetical protein